MSALSPDEMWTDLKAEMLRRIEEIDSSTPWQEVEPAWWLEMMAFVRQLRARP